MMTFGSLFAGIGGLDLGLERAGMTCSWQVEIDDYATRVLERHWPNVRRWRDVKTFPPDTERNGQHETTVDGGTTPGENQGRLFESEGQDNGWYVDLICGGFPCQDISYAGRGAGLAGERSGLFFEVVRVVRQLRPRYVLLENVAALLTRGLDRVLGELATIGYDAEWHCIPAAAVGAPHIRDRVFVIATYATRAASDAKPRLEWRPIFGSNARAELAALERANRECGGQWAVEPAVGELVDGLSHRLVRFAGRVATGIPNRVDKLRCLGNAVVPQVGEYLGRVILQHEQANSATLGC